MASEKELMEYRAVANELRVLDRMIDLLHGRLNNLAAAFPEEAVYAACEAMSKVNGNISKARLPAK